MCLVVQIEDITEQILLLIYSLTIMDTTPLQDYLIPMCPNFGVLSFAKLIVFKCNSLI